MKRRKIPARMCISCGEMRPKKELIRVVRSPDGNVAIDGGGKASGRGAYLCKRTECVAQAKKRRILERNLGINDCEALFPFLVELCGGYEQ